MSWALARLTTRSREGPRVDVTPPERDSLAAGPYRLAVARLAEPPEIL